MSFALLGAVVPRFLLPFTLLWSSVGLAAESSYYQIVRHPQPVQIPELVLLDTTGKTVKVSQLRGRYVVLNLWATWCGPCVKELPSLDSLQLLLRKEGILIAAVSQDRAPKTVVPTYLAKLNIRQLSSYYDPQASATRALRVPVLPTTLILDPEGREIARIVGALDWMSKETQDLIRTLTQKQN